MTMNKQRAGLLLSLALVLAGNAQVARAQQAVFVTRHAERVEYESADGVLSSTGEERAQALARVLADAGVTAVYISERKRTLQTADPLTQALRIAPTAVGGAGLEQVDATLEMVRARDKNGIVVIVGHSNSVPLFLKALGYSGEVTIGPREHDDLFVVVPNATGPPTMLRLNY